MRGWVRDWIPVSRGELNTPYLQVCPAGVSADPTPLPEERPPMFTTSRRSVFAAIAFVFFASVVPSSDIASQSSIIPSPDSFCRVTCLGATALQISWLPPSSLPTFYESCVTGCLISAAS
jgi:hypothetical protein